MIRVYYELRITKNSMLCNNNTEQTFINYTFPAPNVFSEVLLELLKKEKKRNKKVKEEKNKAFSLV